MNANVYLNNPVQNAFGSTHLVFARKMWPFRNDKTEFKENKMLSQNKTREES